LGKTPTGAPADQPSGLAPGRNWTWPLNRSPFAMFQKARSPGLLRVTEASATRRFRLPKGGVGPNQGSDASPGCASNSLL